MRPFVPSLLTSAAVLAAAFQSSPARACGGFFCGRQPVDQTAERILFEVGEGSVTMTTQISFNGDAADFAWVLPLSDVPEADSLAVFPQRALNALDAGSGPLFQLPDDSACYFAFPFAESGAPVDSAQDDSAGGGGDVQVYIRAEVGEYDVAVVGSEDPAQLVAWLRDNDYRITAAMEPYVRQYTEEGLKFLALKLLDTADVRDLSPFRFTLPGTTPTIPLRMTALAAEPEMSIVAFVLADQRFESKNWANVEIADDQITFDPFSFQFPVPTNWAALVASGVDAAGGEGWVTEFAGSSEPYAQQVQSQIERGFFPMEEDEAAAEALLGVLQAHPYMTRLYTRLSAEEMQSDPVFGRSALGDVDREHQLSRIVDGVDQCSEERRESTNPCDFATCGAAGLCRPVPVAELDLAGAQLPTAMDDQVAACACLPGATARTTFAPDGTPTVICQDGRLSFLNPGDIAESTGEVLPDPCATFRCGQNGQCVSMNMTPTCVCDQGFVAAGGFDPQSGARVMSCVRPVDLVPASFYQQALPALPEALPGGRDVEITDPLPMADGGEEQVPMEMPPATANTDFPMPRFDPSVPGSDSFQQAGEPNGGARSSSGGCSVGSPAPASPRGWAATAALVALAFAGRRRRRGERATG